jgi:hypothetical protein
MEVVLKSVRNSRHRGSVRFVKESKLKISNVFNRRTIWKVTSSELLPKQAMRKKIILYKK